MNDRDKLLRKIQSTEFAVWELHMFLDTHPDNREAANKLQEEKKKAKTLKEEYEEKFGPICENENSVNRWSWIQDPWPWERSGMQDNVEL